MTAKQIIIASTHPFMADMRLGTSYLAEALCKLGWNVLYIEQPTSPLHLVHPPGSQTSPAKGHRRSAHFLRQCTDLSFWRWQFDPASNNCAMAPYQHALAPRQTYVEFLVEVYFSSFFKLVQTSWISASAGLSDRQSLFFFTGAELAVACYLSVCRPNSVFFGSDTGLISKTKDRVAVIRYRALHV